MTVFQKLNRRQRTTSAPRTRLCLMMALFMLAFAGCGGDGIPAFGRVTLDGQPLSAGVIKFVPEQGTEAETVSAKIVNGDYAFDASTGPRPGRYLVEIRADDPPPEGMDDPAAFVAEVGAAAANVAFRHANSVDAAFNTQTTLSADVQPGESQEFDFAVRGAPR